MTYVSVRPERHSYAMIKESGEFVINLTTERLVRAADLCGVRSGPRRAEVPLLPPNARSGLGGLRSAHRRKPGKY